MGGCCLTLVNTGFLLTVHFVPSVAGVDLVGTDLYSVVKFAVGCSVEFVAVLVVGFAVALKRTVENLEHSHFVLLNFLNLIFHPCAIYFNPYLFRQEC